MVTNVNLSPRRPSQPACPSGGPLLEGPLLVLRKHERICVDWLTPKDELALLPTRSCVNAQHSVKSCLTTQVTVLPWPVIRAASVPNSRHEL